MVGNDKQVTSLNQTILNQDVQDHCITNQD